MVPVLKWLIEPGAFQPDFYNEFISIIETDPIGQRVRASKKPYSARKRDRAGLSSWWADFGLVGLKNLYVFSSKLLALETKKKHWFFQCFDSNLVGRSGIEPLASTVWRWHSTAELTTHFLILHRNSPPQGFPTASLINISKNLLMRQQFFGLRHNDGKRENR